MWSRCWWATWVSGFFGIAGALHLLRAFLKISVTVADRRVPLSVSVIIGVLFVGMSAGFLLLELQREKSKRQAKEKKG